MFGTTNPEVLVVGAGPVGLFSALRLAKAGVRIEIIDRDWRTGAHSYALALHPWSLGLLRELGLVDRIPDEAYPVRTVGIYDGADRRAELKVPDRDDQTGFVAAMRQDVLEKLLEDELKRHGVKVLWNHELSHLAAAGERMVATVDKMAKESVGYAVAHTEWIVAGSEKLRVPLVIGADGHRSMVRRSLGIDYQSVGQAEHFAVFEFKTSFDPDHEMQVVLDDRATSVLWPLADGYCRWSFQLADYTAEEMTRKKECVAVQVGAARFPVLTQASLRMLLAQRAPWFDGTVEDIRWRMVVRFERRLASALGSGRGWLAGDAVHMTGPAGMQSMNVGLREAEDLTTIIAGQARNGPSTEPLEAYSDRWLHRWRFLMGLEGGLKPREKTDPWIAHNAARLLPCLPASGDDLADLAGQLKLDVDWP
jgi:3-(3-hydroxy-phenyl)propionate hydroxylase